MPMTNASMNAQTRPATGANATPDDSFAPDVVVSVPDTKASALKPGDPNWNHCDYLNAGGTSATPGVVTKPAVMDGGKPRGAATVPSNDPYKL